MKRPLLWAALLLIAGIVIGDNVVIDWRWPALAGGTAAFAALTVATVRRFLIPVSVILTGVSIQTMSTSVLSPYDLRTLIGNAPELATVRGRLTETPFERVSERRGKEHWRTMAFVELSSISSKRFTNSPAHGTVAVSTSGLLPAGYYAGQLVEISGVAQWPKGPLAEGLFDYRKYLGRLGIACQVQVSSTNDWRLLEPSRGPPLADQFLSWAQKALARGLPETDEPVRLLWAMTLGWKTGLSGEVSEPFIRSGTMHIFAISGLHIALIALIIVSVLRVFAVPRSACGLLVIPLIWIYTGITGWQASAIRSTIMTSVIVAGWAINRPSDLINSLACAALIILAYDPQQLFQAGFQLSFLCVLSLALVAPRLTKLKDALLEPDPFLPDELRPKAHLWLRRRVHWLLAAVITSLAAWLGSMPLVAYYFHFLTPSSLVANLLVVPMSSAALASNLASLALAWLPPVAELFNHAAWCFMYWMIQISEWSANLPLGCFNVEAPSPLAFVAYYFVLASVMAGWLLKPKLQLWCFATIVLLSGAWVWQWQHHRSEARISIVSLSGGQAIYAEHAASRAQVLIDCGDEDAVRMTTKPFLRAHGVNHLPAMLLTHGAVREMGGVDALREIFPVEHFYASPLRFRSPAYRRVVERLEDEPSLLKRIKRGDRLGPWTILHPDAQDKFARADDGTIVALGEFNNVRVLLLSDLGRAGQNSLLSRTPNLRADIVVAGLPHGSEPLSEPLLEAIQPRAVIVTDALYPALEHANRKLRQRLKAHPLDLWFTSDCGGVTIAIRNGHWEIQAAHEIQNEEDSQPTQADTPPPTPTEPEE